MSTIIKQLQVRRDDLTQSRVVSVDAAPLEPGEVLARIDSFALTANNVTYGVSGDSIGYWNFFPAAEGWGHIPVWGYATVIESRCDEVPVGEQVWGFLPMASHVVMQPSGVRHGHFVDAAAHRAALPSLYNRYQNTAGDPPALKALADERSGLFPLFTTSYVIADFLADNDWFGARQVIVLSASSKTGFGLANILHNWADKPVSVIGATSGGNRDFVESLGICDQVIAYDQIDTLDPQVPTIVVDMAGSAPILTALAAALPSTVPFTGPETLERQQGQPFLARLGANESLFGPSPAAIEAMARAASQAWMYGDPENHDLKAALAVHHGCGAENIVVGEGIDGLLGYLARLMIEAGTPVVTSLGAYPTFNFHVAGYGGTLHRAPYSGDHEDPDALLALARQTQARLLYIANPDNPMGSHHPGSRIAAMLDALPEQTLLVLDEAYVDLAPPGTEAPIAADDPRVIRLRTFSKAHGLAGLRVGYVPDYCTDEVADHTAAAALSMLRKATPIAANRGIEPSAVAVQRAMLEIREDIDYQPMFTYDPVLIVSGSLVLGFFARWLEARRGGGYPRARRGHAAAMEL